MELVKKQCKTCNKQFMARLTEIKRGMGNYCSIKCAAIAGGKARAKIDQNGVKNPNWKGGISKDNYHYKKLQIKRYPLRMKARDEIRKALRSGKLVRIKKCEICNKICKTEAHHEDYNKPLKVHWLCRKCHRNKQTP